MALSVTSQSQRAAAGSLTAPAGSIYYKPYVWPAPTSTPTPDPGILHVGRSSQFRSSWGLGLGGGGSLPLGNLSANNGSGGLGVVDAYYRATRILTVNLLGQVSSMPYTGVLPDNLSSQGSPSPMSTYGAAVLLDFEVFRLEQLSAWLGLGGGYMACQRTVPTTVATHVGSGIVDEFTLPTRNAGASPCCCASARATSLTNIGA